MNDERADLDLEPDEVIIWALIEVHEAEHGQMFKPNFELKPRTLRRKA